MITPDRSPHGAVTFGAKAQETGTTGYLVRHRQRNGAATDMVDLKPPASHSDATGIRSDPEAVVRVKTDLAQLLVNRARTLLPCARKRLAAARTRIGGAWQCPTIILLFGAAMLAALADADLSGRPANALPLYAQQTGQPCATCHTAFPELTPFGRRFKLSGYTLDGGDSFLPFSGLVEPAFTHNDEPANAARNVRRPGGGRGGAGGGGGDSGATASNNDLVPEQVAVFTGGRIADTLGAFVRGTYSHASGQAAWDNADLRYADAGKLAGQDLIWGVSFNNNPTVQDVWNTIPAWRFPYHVRRLERPPAGRAMTATSIEGGFSRRSLGLGGYAYFDDLIYVELSGYRSLSSSTQRWLGVNPSANAIEGVAPYWRLAIEPWFGNQTIEVGTFGLQSNTVPSGMAVAGTDATTDLGVDAQYQWIGDERAVTVRGSWIHEDRGLKASRALGLADNSHNLLHSLHLSASYIFDNTWSFTADRFSFGGTRDAVLYRPTGSPSNSGWTAEIAYIPFMHGGPSFWPWLNARLGLQYTFNDQNTHYNTLFLYALILF